MEYPGIWDLEIIEKRVMSTRNGFLMTIKSGTVKMSLTPSLTYHICCQCHEQPTLDNTDSPWATLQAHQTNFCCPFNYRESGNSFPSTPPAHPPRYVTLLGARKLVNTHGGVTLLSRASTPPPPLWLPPYRSRHSQPCLDRAEHVSIQLPNRGRRDTSLPMSFGPLEREKI